MAERDSGSTRVADADLRADIETVLRRRAQILALPPALEARYETATWRGRGRSLRGWLIIVAVIDLLCIGVDAVAMPAHLTESIIARGVVLTTLYLGAAALLWRPRPAWFCGLAILIPTFALILVAGYLGALAGGVHEERYLTAAMFTIFATTVVPNVRFRWAVAQAVVSVLTIGFLFFSRSKTSMALLPVAALFALTYRAGWKNGLPKRRTTSHGGSKTSTRRSKTESGCWPV